MVGSSRGGGLHTVLWVQRLFPDHFKNFVFISAKAVDAQSYGGAEQIKELEAALKRALSFYVDYCHANGLAATARFALGTDRVDQLVKLAEEVQREFPNSVFFTSKLVFRNETWLTRLLHNQTALALQREAASERHADGDPADAALRLATAKASRRRDWPVRRRARCPGSPRVP